MYTWLQKPTSSAPFSSYWGGGWTGLIAALRDLWWGKLSSFAYADMFHSVTCYLYKPKPELCNQVSTYLAFLKFLSENKMDRLSDKSMRGFRQTSFPECVWSTLCTSSLIFASCSYSVSNIGLSLDYKAIGLTVVEMPLSSGHCPLFPGSLQLTYLPTAWTPQNSTPHPHIASSSLSKT